MHMIHNSVCHFIIRSPEDGCKMSRKYSVKIRRLPQFIPLKIQQTHTKTWTDQWSIMISGSNEQLQQKLEYTLLKPDCHSWWISKMQSGCEDTLEERCATNFCFKLGKNATETCGMLQTAFRPSFMNRASVFVWHKRLKEGRESVRDDEKCRRSKEVNTPELIGQRIWVRVTMLRL